MAKRERDSKRQLAMKEEAYLTSSPHLTSPLSSLSSILPLFMLSLSAFPFFFHGSLKSTQLLYHFRTTPPYSILHSLGSSQGENCISMTGADYFLDEIDCGSFFDQIDDLIEFPTDNDCGLGVGSVNCGEFSTIWSDPPSGLLDSDPIFAGNHSNSAASDLSAQVSVPYEDIVQMEWLSNFVEDSFAVGEDMTLVKENYPIKKESPQNPFHSTSPVSVLESSTTTTSSSSSSSSSVGKAPISLTGPQRARTKRPRPATFGPRPSIRIISPTSSFTGPTSKIVPESDNFADSHLPKVMGDDSDHMKKIFKKKKKTMINNSVHHQPSVNLSIRKCMHCEITKTPQWRAGPMGPKTLCNACGVRYKSGRLFPEYRPAASPTFVPALHSNSHKKVVEMRTKTPLVVTEAQPELVPNFHPGLDYV